MTDLDRAIHSFVLPLEAEHAVISPGSRNAPVIKALVNTAYTCHTVVDERSAAFQALGMAKFLRQAVILSCTSGTAALNYYPAIAEAFYARVPLIVLTADRPKVAIDNWDGQAIRQKHVFSSHVRLSLETPQDHSDLKEYERLAAVVNEYLENEVPGPIHINIPLREPLYSNEESEIRMEDRQFIKNDSILLLDLDDYLPSGLKAEKYLVVNGMEDGELIVVQTKEDQSYEDLVILSDVSSNQSSSVKYWDAMLYTQMRNDPSKLEKLVPDVLITTGTTTVSKGLKLFLRKYKPKHHFHISSCDEVGDPFYTSPEYIDPFKPKRNHSSFLNTNSSYLESWNEMSNDFFQKFLDLDWTDYNEFSAVKKLLGHIPNGSFLHLASSMPVRWVSYLMDDSFEFEIYANRGTSGIDGCTSTALGHASITTLPVYLITGDIAFLYDINALYRDQLPANLKVVVLNNEGGRIFEMIDGPEAQTESLPFQITEHHRSMDKLCSHFGLEYFCAENFEELTKVFKKFEQSSSPAVLEIKTDPIHNKAIYTQFKEITL